MNIRNGLFNKRTIYGTMIFCMFFSLLAFPTIGLCAEYYVKTPANGGSNANSGLDWGSAKATIGAAMALADGDDNIYVAAGTYNEKVTFAGYNNIALRGGYPSAGGAAQDPAANITIIDGSGISSAAPMVYVPMQAGGTSGYFGIVVEGFTIRNGTHTGNGCAGIESYSVGITIKRNIIENNSPTGASGYAGGIHVFCPLNDLAKVTIEQNIVRNNSAAGVGGISLEGAAGKTGKYTAYLVNNLIVGNHSTTADASWNRGVGGVDIIYPASASIVNCTIADNTAAHPTNPIGGVSISGYSAAEKGIAAIANSIIGHDSGKDILADANGTLWIAYSGVKDATVSGTGVIHTNPLFVGSGDYHLTESSPCRNTGSAAGTVLTGPIKSPSWSYLPDVAWKSSVGYPDSEVTLSWGDGVHNLSSQWRYDDALSTSAGYPIGRFFGTANAGCTAPSSCTADVSYHMLVSNMSAVDASGYSYSTNNNWGGVDPWSTRHTMFYRGTNGYYGAWFLNGIAYTTHGTSKDGRLSGTWYFQVNGGPYFDAGIRTVDLDGKIRPEPATGYDMGAYEYHAPVNGVCGPADGQTFVSPPTSDLCSSGTATAVVGTGPWTWSCIGLDGGTTADCSANIQLTGSLQVTILPQGAVDAGGQWRRTGTSTWFNSGSTETGIPVGPYDVEFKAVTGWNTPASVAVTIGDGTTETATGTYVQQMGSLQVTILPQGAVNAGGQWRRAGTSTWFDSGSTETGIPVGACTVEFKPVTGWDTPASVAVTIGAGTTETASGTYVQQVAPVPIIQVSPGSLNFSYVPVGSAKDLPLTVRNAGGGTLTGNATTTPPFGIVSGGSYSLGSGQTQAVVVRYQPTSPGPHVGTVVFTGGSGATVPVTGKTESAPGLHWMMLLLFEN